MPNVVKIGLSPKQQLQAVQSYDFTTKLITTTATQYWIVVFDAPQSDPTACLVATLGGISIPKVGSTMSNLTCTRVQPMLELTSGGKSFRVQVDYSSRPQPQFNSNKWDITVSIDGDPVQETIYFDGGNKAIQNSAGQPFTQQPSRVFYDGVYRVQFKSSSINIAAVDGLQGFLNQNAFTLNIASLGFSKMFEAQSTELARCPSSAVLTGDPTKPTYWQVEYELHYRKPIKSPIDQSMVSGWTLFVVDQGYCTKPASGNTPVVIMDTSVTPHVPLNSPAYLDGAGNQSPTAVYLKFAPTQPTGDFTPLFSGIA